MNEERYRGGELQKAGMRSTTGMLAAAVPAEMPPLQRELCQTEEVVGNLDISMQELEKKLNQVLRYPAETLRSEGETEAPAESDLCERIRTMRRRLEAALNIVHSIDKRLVL